MDTNVLIVGTGPTGLMLAGFLTPLGIRPPVIDKKQGLTEAQPRALIVVPRTLETYDLLGIVERTLKPHLQVYGALSPEVEAFAPQHPEFPLTRFSFTPEAARAGLQAGACYLLRPDGYVGVCGVPLLVRGGARFPAGCLGLARG